MREKVSKWPKLIYPTGCKDEIIFEGKEDWLEEGLLVPAKKNKRGRIIDEGPSAAQEEEGASQDYVPPYGGISIPPRHYGGVPMQAWGEWCSRAPTNSLDDTQYSLCGSVCTPSSTTTKCGHLWRIRCKEHAKYCSHPI
jgi:hypothetical protein